MSHDTIIIKIRGGYIRRDYEEGSLTEKEITNVKLACYVYLQRHRHELEQVKVQLKAWLPEIFHEEIDKQVEMIRQAEENKKRTIAETH